MGIVLDYLYALIVYPIEIFIESIFTISMKMIPTAGYAILLVSIAVQVLTLPIYKRAEELQNEERDRQNKMQPVVTHIKKTFKGDERVMMLSAYYREQKYHSYYQFRTVLPLLIQIPFFIAAYSFLSNCQTLSGSSFYFLKDMGKPDALFTIGNHPVNIMPVLMTVINVMSGMVYSHGMGRKDKLQLYITAAVFLVLLYSSPSGLVFYWTLNNLFSLIKNILFRISRLSKPIICAASLLFSMAYSFKSITYGALQTETGVIVIVLLVIMGIAPSIALVTEKKKVPKRNVELKQDEIWIFRVFSMTLAVLLGILIPTSVVASSPTEFVIRGHYINPMAHIGYCFVVALGLFVFWGTVLLKFNSSQGARIICCLVFALCVCSMVNSQFFRNYLKNMSMNLSYYDGVGCETGEIILNLIVVFILSILCIVLYRINKRAVFLSGIVMLSATVMLSFVNFAIIQKNLNSSAHITDDEYYINNSARYCLDKKGKNVLVLFEDRAFGPYIPYIFNEKPELADKFSGFTLYSNTLSFGTHTSTGAPVIYGGYEYMPYALKDKDEEFRTDSVKVMPKIFAQNGFKTTVFDCPLYVDLANTTIEGFFKEVDPTIRAYYGDGVIKTKEEAERDYEYFKKAARSNFIRHSIFISSPIVIRRMLYDRGAYLMQSKAEDRVIYGGHIEELNKLGDMASVSDSGDNTFTIIENETTHSMDINLQMPDYTLEDKTDNSNFITEWREKLLEFAGERGINLNTDQQIQAYEVNMAAMISIGNWLDYLRGNDLYDNTRIIIVADHGYSYFAFDDMIMDNDGIETDLDMFTPLLMVKDFADADQDVSKDLKTSDEFMTNADVPTIAMDGLINEPVNPYTGKSINSDQKKERDLYVWDDRIWLKVHDNVNDSNNWSVVDIENNNG